MSGQSTISDFLARKVRLHLSSFDYIDEHRTGLQEARNSGKLQELEFEGEMDCLDEQCQPILDELRVLKKQEHSFNLDLSDWCEEHQAKRSKNIEEPSVDFFERAYAAVMVRRVMANAKQKGRSKFDQLKFRKVVIKHLNAEHESDPGLVWCHLTGWLESDRIKAAYLVPKCMKGDELTHLFGDGEVILSAPTNGK